LLSGKISVAKLLRDLSGDLAALVRFGVDVDVHLSGHQIGGLRIGEGCATFRAAGGILKGNDDGRVLAGFGGAGGAMVAGPVRPE
jgi:hypothetical protein